MANNTEESKAVVVLPTTLPALSPADENCTAIYNVVADVKHHFLTLGYLLHVNRSNAYFSAAHVDTFKDFCEMHVHLQSYSWLCKLADIAEIIADQLVSKADVLEIGPTKMALLLPLVKRSLLTSEILAIAKMGTANDLRLELGMKQSTRQAGVIHCPGCGGPLTWDCPRCGRESEDV